MWVAWLAVYYEDDFWGLVATRQDSTRLLPQAGVDGQNDAPLLALRDDTGKIVYGPASVFESQPVTTVVESPSGRWELAAIPKEGWEDSVRDQILMFNVAGLIIVGLVSGMVYLIGSRQTQLAATVRQRTWELSAVNRQLKEDIAKREAVEAERERLLQQLEQRVSERTHHLKTLYDVTAVANASLDLREILERSLDRIVEAVGSEGGVIHLHNPRQGALRVVASKDFPHEPCHQRDHLMEKGELSGSYCWVCTADQPPVKTDTTTRDDSGLPFLRPGTQAHVGVPLRGKGQLTGVLCLFRQREQPFDREEATLLAAIGEQLGAAVENARLFAAAQAAAALEERQRLAGELHDSVTQLIYSDMLMAEATRQMVAAGDAAAADKYLERLGETAQQALKEMRLLLFELRSSGLSEEGLEAALQRRLDAVEKRAGLGAQLLVDGAIDLPPALEEGLYRIAHEALNNALKHAAATSVAIELRADGDQVEMKVSDDGRGFDPNGAASSGGLGLTTMHERARRLGGSLAVQSTPGAGTVVQVKVQLGRAPFASQSD